MRRWSGVVLAGLLAGAWAAPLRAQNGTGPLDPQCAGGSTVFQDVCQKTTDLFNLLAPQLGVLVAGGNATLGRGTPLGVGKWTIGLRIHTVLGAIPDLSNIPADTGAAKRSSFALQTIPIPLPMLNGGIGVLPQRTAGETKVGGLDVLVNVAYLPNVARGGVSLRLPNGSLQLGYGARLGIVDLPGRWPALSLTWIERDLPLVHAAANYGPTSDHVELQQLRVKTSAWRLVASGDVGRLHLDAGAGRDRAISSMNIFVELQPPRCTYGPASCSGRPFNGFAQTAKPSQLFLDASLHAWRATWTIEVGRAGAIAVPTFNTFTGGEPGAARWTGALGVRFGTGR